MKRLWAWIYLTYVGFWAKHSAKPMKSGLKVVVTHRMLQVEVDKNAIKSAAKIMTAALDKQLFDRHAVVSKDIEVWIEEIPEYRGREFGIVVEYLGTDKWARHLPAPKVLWRERVLALDKWWENQRPIIERTFGIA